ncbi:sigma-70 family RNA polymerase sigma factor [Sphingomonas sp. UYP23]
MRASEEQLKIWMIGGLNGDASAHAALLKSIVPLLHAFYRRRMGSDDDAEDLVQETLIAVHTRRATFDPDRVFTAWLFAIARYKMIDNFRRHHPVVPIEGLLDELIGTDFEEANNARIDIDHLLAALPSKQAGAIRRTRIDGLSVAETAHEARIGQSDVKVSIHRGIKALTARVLGDRR